MTESAASPTPLQGIIPPMITPLADRDTLDAAGLESLIEHILGGGVHGLFILGTTGEGPSLSHSLRCELIDRVCDQVAGRVPVLVGVTDTSFAESVNMADYAADAGAAAVVLSAPYYFPAGQTELIQYVEHITAELSLPLLLYNMPSHTKVPFEPETVRRLMDNPQIIGIKDSSFDMVYFRQLCRMSEDRPDWTLLVGPEELLAETVLLGSNGGVCGGANLYPRLLVDLYEAARAGHTELIRQFDDSLRQFRETIYAVDKSGARTIKGLKCALSCLGICNDFMAEPFHRFRTRDRRKIQAHLDRLQIPLHTSVSTPR